MPKIGITGHTNLAAESTRLILAALQKSLATYDSRQLVGITCLARGADQLFAHALLDQGGALEVVLPSADYRQRKVGADNLVEFDELINQAARVHTMPYEYADQHAYMAASEWLLDNVQELIAVWDGEPSASFGGTADVVEAARKRGIPMTICWPSGAERT